MKVITLGLSSLHPMELKYPGWWDVHRAAMTGVEQKPDALCPVCRELFGADTQDAALKVLIENIRLDTQRPWTLLV